MMSFSKSSIMALFGSMNEMNVDFESRKANKKDHFFD